MTQPAQQQLGEVRRECEQLAAQEVADAPPLTEQQQRLIRATFSTRLPARRTRRSA